MKIRRSVALLFLAVLLVVANEAVAACAWVLWVEDDRVSDPKKSGWGVEKTDWRLLGASSNEADCQRKLRDAIERVTTPDNKLDNAGVMYKVTGDTVSFAFFPKDAKLTDAIITHSQLLRYFCLPDTIDPRNPKARQ